MVRIGLEQDIVEYVIGLFQSVEEIGQFRELQLRDQTRQGPGAAAPGLHPAPLQAAQGLRFSAELAAEVQP